MNSRPRQRSQKSQTDFSALSLLEKLKQKDLEIQKLQRELNHFKTRNLSLNQDITKIINQTPSSFKLTKPDAFQIHQGKLFTSQEPIRPKSIPLDTASIEELSSFSKNLPKPGRRSKNRKILSNDKSIKNAYIKNSKLSLKAKKTLDKKSIYPDPVSQDAQDIETWSSLLTKFKEDPRHEQIRYSSAEPVQVRTRTGSSYYSRKTSQDISETRPISANKSQFRPLTAKVQDIDWSKSVLDSLVAKGNPDFNSTQLYSFSEVEEILQKKCFKNIKEIFEKTMKTQEKLKTELMLPKNFMVVPAIEQEGIEGTLKNCLELFKARALIVRILKLIHGREHVMLRLVASEDERVEKDFELMEKMGQEILQIIDFLKHGNFPIRCFVYLGEDYSVKVQEDTESILALYPKLKKEDIFAEYSL